MPDHDSNNCPQEFRACPQETRITLVEKTVSHLDHRLYGNGQPGDIQKIMARQNEIESDMTERQEAMKTDLGKKIDALGEKIGRVVVVVAVLASSSGAGAGYLFKALFGG
jgi:archaellum component FlaC